MKILIGENLRFLRGGVMLSQDKLSEKLDMSRQRYESYENNRNQPDILTIKKFMDFFKVDFNQLCFEDLKKASATRL
jgi:transcriptional regulator with XRE-family HTH domain